MAPGFVNPGAPWVVAIAEVNERHPARAAPRVAVVVVGDLGRSPRMQAHALALANRGASVDLVGYGDSPVYPEIERHPAIRVHELRLPRLLRRQPRGRLRYVFAAISKLLIQHCQLFHALLFRITRPSVLLVQNPPPVAEPAGLGLIGLALLGLKHKRS